MNGTCELLNQTMGRPKISKCENNYLQQNILSFHASSKKTMQPYEEPEIDRTRKSSVLVLCTIVSILHLKWEVRSHESRLVQYYS